MRRMAHIYCRRMLATGSATLVLACSLPGHAQENTGTASAPENAQGQAEEIIVTARRTNESLISVPVAVTALSAKDIDRYNANDLKKIAQLAPQLIIAEAGSGSGASFAVRGIGSSAVDAGLEQTVALNIDGVQASRGRLIRQGFFDLQQIEILKGPQALFFGKNSPAGVISLSSVNPTGNFEGYVRSGYEFSSDERYLEGAVSGPISSTLRARLAVRGAQSEGYITNTATPRPTGYAPGINLPGALDNRQPGTKELIGRLTLVYEPSSAFDATLKILAGKFRSNTDSNGAQAVCGTGQILPTAGGISDPDGDCKLDRRRSSSAIPTAFLVDWPGVRADGNAFARQDSVLASLTMNYDAGPVLLTSVTGYLDLKTRGFDDFTFTAVGRIWGLNGEDTKQFSQELRAVTQLDGPLNFTFGGFFEDNSVATISRAMVAYLGPDPATGRFYSYDRAFRVEGNTYSAFAQARFALAEDVELAGGVRYTKDKKDLMQGQNLFVRAPLPFLSPTINLTGEFSDNDWSPEATLTWHPTPDSTLYAAYKTGYKSGGFSQPTTLPAGTTTDRLRFGSESASGGEIGYKSRLFDRTVRVELTAYQYDFSNLQLTSFDAANLSFLIRNAGKARSRGIEGSVDWRVTPDFQLRGAFGYNKADYRSFAGAPCYAGQTAAQGCTAADPLAPAALSQNLTGRPLARAPKFTFNIGASYEIPLSGDLRLGVSSDVDHSGSYFTQENLNPVAFQKDFWRLNASVRLSDESSGWELALLGRNLTNSRYFVNSTDKPAGRAGEIGTSLQRPREIALQATWRF